MKIDPVLNEIIKNNNNLDYKDYENIFFFGNTGVGKSTIASILTDSNSI